MQVENDRVTRWFGILHHMGQGIVLALRVNIYIHICAYIGNMQTVGDGVHLEVKLAQERKGGCEGQAISQLQRQSFSSREYIDTSETHNPVYNIHE